MSECSGSASGSIFSTGTGGASSNVSNDDSRALTALQDGSEEDDVLDTNNRSFQEAVFSTIYLISKNKAVDTSLRLAALRVVAEFLQLFLVLFNPTWSWHIQQDFWAYKAVSWLLFKMLWMTEGYQTYISGFYFLTAATLASSATTVWIAVVLKGENAENAWLKRLVGALQLLSLVFCGFWWVGMLDYIVYMFDCQWPNLASGAPVHHVGYPEQDCLAMPHLAHMLVAVVIMLIFCWNVFILALGSVDMNLMSRNILASSDTGTTVKILATKMVLVILCTSLDDLGKVQAVLVLLTTVYLMHLHNGGMSFYAFYVNAIWTGLAWALLYVAGLLTALEFTFEQHLSDPAYAVGLTMAVLYGILPALLWGVFGAWCHHKLTQRTSSPLLAAYQNLKQGATTSSLGDLDTPDKLKKFFRFKDVSQVALFCRVMRKWDPDGAPDEDAVALGEFILKCGMARLPDNPTLLVLYANHLLEVRKDGQAARIQLQLAQKTNPSLLQGYSIYAAQRRTKQLHKDGDALDLLSYVEYQRNYRSCVRAHKAALLTQRQFWSCFMHEGVHYKDIQKRISMMEIAEQRASMTYKRVLERYPANGRLLKIYGRFLEYIRHDPWTASKFYAEALKQGTSESLINLARGQGGDGALAQAGSVNEKVDGVIVINAHGSILMLNPAAMAIFGYDKGELEGKNVSVLMPAPFSTMHDSFLKRYIGGGEPHIIGKTRAMVALTKERSMIPISLWVTKLSGVGAETLFIGVVRRVAPDICSEGRVVRFWTTSAGLMLCADNSTADTFGLEPSDLMGQPFSGLCEDGEAVARYIAQAAASDAREFEEAVKHKTTARLMHRYLPPVDVELKLTCGGATTKGSDCRTIIISVHIPSGTSAVLALDFKGRIMYATDKLASMLKYPVASLIKMDLKSLLPQPYCQMHGAWFKDLSRTPRPTSCRAGAIVHLLSASGDKLPVTLKISTRQHVDKGMLHVVQVSKVDDAAAVNQHCLQLSINHQGTILETNAGVPKSLYGFAAAELIGKPLAAIIDTFGLWRLKFGEDKSLLLLLASQALQGLDAAAAAASTSWRVGVHMPLQKDEDIQQHAEKLTAELQGKGNATASTGGLLQALQRHNRLRPACMTVEMLHIDDKVGQDQAAADSMAVMKVSLRRADALSTVLELDKHLAISQADEAAGLIFASHPRKLLNQSFLWLIGLPQSTTFEDLLGQKGTAATKGAMKGTAAGAGASRMGVARRVTTKHPVDGKSLVLEMQAMSHQQAGNPHQLVRLQLVEPASASFQIFLQLKEGKQLCDTVAVQEAVAGDQVLGHAVPGQENVAAASPRAGSEELEGHRRAIDHVTTWVRESSRLPKTDDSPDHDMGHGDSEEYAEQGTEEPTAGVSSGWQHQGGREHKHQEADEPEAPAANQLVETAYGCGPQPAGYAARAGRRVSGVGSVAESAADGASSIGDGASEGAGHSAVGHEEDLAVDARRAKRLKKLNRLVQGNAAQLETREWRSRTVMLLSVMLLAHIVCFAVVYTQIDNRYSNVDGVANLARALDGFMVMLLRANLIQKCWLPESIGSMWACGTAQLKLYQARLQRDVQKAYTYHQLTYLNGGKGFEDKQMMAYWTYKELPEYNFLHDYVLPDGTPSQHLVKEGTNTLWVMGNIMASAGKDLYFMVSTRSDDEQLRRELNETTAWQYIYQNGVQSVFEGYAWSMDNYIGYCWTDLLSLASVAVVLLVIEVIVVHLSCLAYELWLIQRCNVSHMKLFSVFLALPSATIRQMTQRPLQVDDDAGNDPGDDDLDMVDAGQATAVEAGAASRGKSVRMEVAGVDELDGEEAHRPARSSLIGAAGRSSGRSKAKQKGRDKPQLTGFALLNKKATKRFFGWIRPKFKLNGKTLMSNSNIVWRFMVPLLLWIAAAIIIFGVSVQELQGLDKPIAALDTSAHVLYNLARTRVAANLLAFSKSAEENAVNRAFLQQELEYFQEEYRSMLYGGKMQLKANVTFNPVAPASVFSDQAISDLFFRTSACLKADKSTCITDQNDPFYNSVHSGLDVMVNRYIQEMDTFSRLPDNMAYANHSSYVWVLKVGAADLHDGLETAGELFVQHTINRLESVKQLHIVLLVITLACLILFLLFLYRPYIKLLQRDCKIVAGMLSQLPAEVDVEGHVKTVVLGWARGPGSQSVIGGSGSMVVAGSGGSVLNMNIGGGFLAAHRGSYTDYDIGSQAMQTSQQPGVRGSYPGYGMDGLGVGVAGHIGHRGSFEGYGYT